MPSTRTGVGGLVTSSEEGPIRVVALVIVSLTSNCVRSPVSFDAHLCSTPLRTRHGFGRILRTPLPCADRKATAPAAGDPIWPFYGWSSERLITSIRLAGSMGACCLATVGMGMGMGMGMGTGECAVPTPGATTRDHLQVIVRRECTPITSSDPVSCQIRIKRRRSHSGWQAHPRAIRWLPP